ncbi:hypothetical protein J6590_097706 [Homalodisca vitripennis]|nr:hypothetical protein J6590_055200 [Homalodisca vitripennis]KAG8334097.1 hypothetical protein J6590_097706 [Homalodisca vitripennis]
MTEKAARVNCRRGRCDDRHDARWKGRPVFESVISNRNPSTRKTDASNCLFPRASPFDSVLPSRSEEISVNESYISEDRHPEVAGALTKHDWDVSEVAGDGRSARKPCVSPGSQGREDEPWNRHDLAKEAVKVR